MNKPKVSTHYYIREFRGAPLYMLLGVPDPKLDAAVAEGHAYLYREARGEKLIDHETDMTWNGSGGDLW